MRIFRKPMYYESKQETSFYADDHQTRLENLKKMVATSFVAHCLDVKTALDVASTTEPKAPVCVEFLWYANCIHEIFVDAGGKALLQCVCVSSSELNLNLWNLSLFLSFIDLLIKFYKIE